jgi:hypothetical protein
MVLSIAVASTFTAACGAWPDVSAGRDDPVAGSPNDGPPGAARARLASMAPTSCVDQTCQIGPDCIVRVGDCESKVGAAADGSCVAVPNACDDEGPFLVCGCDGRTWANPCTAARAGVGLLALTPCE